MPRDPEKYLVDILDSCDFLLQFKKGRSLSDLKDERGFRSAVERELQIIGEAMMNLEKISPEMAREISECSRIIRFRHVLVHGYDSLNPEIIWNVLDAKLQVLKKEAELLLRKKRN